MSPKTDNRAKARRKTPMPTAKHTSTSNKVKSNLQDCSSESTIADPISEPSACRMRELRHELIALDQELLQLRADTVIVKGWCEEFGIPLLPLSGPSAASALSGAPVDAKASMEQATANAEAASQVDAARAFNASQAAPALLEPAKTMVMDGQAAAAEAAAVSPVSPEPNKQSGGDEELPIAVQKLKKTYAFVVAGNQQPSD
jgi:hypothetical protein